MLTALEKGLSRTEARDRLKEYGENRLEQKKQTSAAAVFAGQFRDSMVLILLAATAVSALLGEVGEALAIAVIVLLNAVIGFLQEWSTEKTLKALSDLAAPAAHVRRDGEEEWIDAKLVVPGDILLLEAGDRVAADGVIISCSAFSCDEAMLTGESVPEHKKTDDGSARTTEEAHASMVFMGTNAVSGRAEVRVTATGMATQMGAIAVMLGEIEEDETPLQRRLDQIGRVIGAGCVGICAVVAATGVLRGEAPLDMLLTGISLAVAAVPEGLPAIVTVSLALAVRRILKRNALVKQLHAVETLGCAGVICSDKTGTLTENKMTVQKVVTALGEVPVRDGAPDMHTDGALTDLVLCAACCNDAKLIQPRNSVFSKREISVSGEPTEAALLIMAAKAGADAQSFYRESERPFDSARKRMSVTGVLKDGRRVSFVKGAPDVLLPLCDRIKRNNREEPMTARERSAILAENERLASDALRVLGFAMEEGGGDAETGLVFLGLVGMSDPPRKEAFEAVAACRSAGIRTVMITGDHEITARAVAAKLKITSENGEVITGKALDIMTDEELANACRRVSVFARVTPAHKLRIVRAMKANGDIVAMTGDGVNDAPALKEANIGVAMGKGGTDVTREAAEVILLDDNFATLVAAVEEGRVIYRNIRRFLRYLLSCNIGEVLTMFGGMLLGMPVVLTPIQLLFVNLATDGLPAIALGMERSDGTAMEYPPRDPDESIFSDGLLGKIVFRGILIGLGTLLVFSLTLGSTSDIEQARTAALVTLVMMQLFHVFECRSEEKSILETDPFGNPLLIGAVAVSLAALSVATRVGFFRGVFGTAVLSGGIIRLALAVSAAAPLCSAVMMRLDSGGSAKRKKRPLKTESARGR